MADELTKEEIDRRALANLRRMIATPPQPKKAKPATAARSDASKPRKRGRVGAGS
jgi:hypothetical protein